MPVRLYGKVSLNMALTILGASLLSALIAFLLSFLLTGPVFRIMMASVDLGPGSIGSPADDSTPVVQSLDEMRDTERFTLLVSEYFQSDTVLLDDTCYTRITLPSGERIAARINQKSTEHLESLRQVRLPVGTLKKWDRHGKQKADYELFCYDGYYTDPDYYMDMAGDFVHVPTEAHASSRVFTVVYLLSVFSIIFLFRRHGVKKGWFPPEILRKKYEETLRSTIPQDDTERWILGTYAIWAGYIGDAHLIGGLPKEPKNQAWLRHVYQRDWGITTGAEFQDMVAQLTAPEGYNGTDPASCAWDWCRAMQLLGCGFFCDYLTRQEMRTLSCQVGCLIQRHFHSWEELCSFYLDGYTRWIRSIGEDPVQKRAQREAIYAQIKQDPDSPYRLSFYLPLKPNAQGCLHQP